MGFFFYLLNDIKCLQTRCREQKVNMKKQKQVINVLAKSNMRQSCNLLQFLHSSSLFGFAMATTRFASTPNDKYEIKIDGTPATRTEMQVNRMIRFAASCGGRSRARARVGGPRRGASGGRGRWCARRRLPCRPGRGAGPCGGGGRGGRWCDPPRRRRRPGTPPWFDRIQFCSRFQLSTNQLL